MVMTHYRNVGAAELGVQERYIPGEGVPLVHDYPYHPAVGELRRLTIQVSPLSKLELIGERVDGGLFSPKICGLMAYS